MMCELTTNEVKIDSELRFIQIYNNNVALRLQNCSFAGIFFGIIRFVKVVSILIKVNTGW